MSRQKIQDCVERFINDEDGATAIEYGLLAALISVGIAGIAGVLGKELVKTFETIKDAMVLANTPPVTPP